MQNKDVPEEIFESTVKTSNAGIVSAHDVLIAHEELEQRLTQDGSTVKLKQKEVILLTEFVDMNKTRFVGVRAFPIIFQPEYIEGKWTIRHDITRSITIR